MEVDEGSEAFIGARNKKHHDTPLLYINPETVEIVRANMLREMTRSAR